MSSLRTLPPAANRRADTESTRDQDNGSGPSLRRTKIGFYGHFGTRNTGNESTLLATLTHSRALDAASEFCCVCSHPEVVAERYGIGAVAITARTTGIWDRKLRPDRRLYGALVGLRQELREYRRAARTLKGAKAFVVPGTGLVTDAYGLSHWGPYNLFKWVLVARVRGCRVMFVSVGVGPVYGRVGRFLVKTALSLARYRSYRDRASLEWARRVGVRTTLDRVYPDLAFSLPETMLRPTDQRTGGRRVVGVGLMQYAQRYSVADPRPESYARYLEAVAGLVDWLLSQDYDVRLLLGDGDLQVIPEFRSVLRSRVAEYEDERVVYEPIVTVEDILAQLFATDFVVATRFHNVLLALLVGKPVVAISFHHKCSSLMAELALSDYCCDLETISAETLIDRFQAVERNAGEVRQATRRRAREAREALDEQYGLLFGTAG